MKNFIPFMSPSTFNTLLATLSSVAVLSLAIQTHAQAESASDAVYQGLGQKAGIASFVQDFVEIITTDHRISTAFSDTDKDRLGFMLTEQFCELSGGPCKYSGKTMSNAHQGMNITNAQFNALAEDLQMAMEKHHIAFSVQNKLIAKLAPMQRTVVTK
ncbi:group I truncated hemoglobin [Undibacterium sp. RuRC25W]|uniref:group I truncated hemoglobin n=1 Tax=Undibacterium sp. RuRC25W TaxID=3413047 RepID=UPI003BF343AF